jgi:hypothetical protein
MNGFGQFVDPDFALRVFIAPGFILQVGNAVLMWW